ncbi:MAG: hypothetical protein JWM68_4160, partial [Verrucomicrobiales bacterium]|nr:hypothetical protein [Verrucomicrobiales bacterium]
MTDISGVTNYTNGIDYSLTNAQIYRLPGSTILDGDFISVSYQSAEITGAGLLLTLSNNFEVEAGGKVDLVGKGYGPNLGIGAGKLFGGVGSGGGHGGSGGSGSGVPGGTTDGTVHQPTKLGSGGSTAGGSGGGAAKIQAGNLARIDGIISMNGTKATNSQMGGGAGGSFWLTAPTFIGAGSISANGGSGELYLGGGGGGGRIAIYADTNLFAGDVVARGGAGWNYGGAGTIYLKGDSNTVAQVIIDNRGVAGTNTFLSVVGSYDLTVQGKAIVVASTLNIGNLTIRSNSWLMPLGTPQALSVTVTRDALIEPNSGFMFNTKGYAGGVGPGTPSFNSLGQGGGGHGGQGGTGWGGFFGASSGSIPSPSTFGSGGGGGSTGGGAGGGAVSLTVSG